MKELLIPPTTAIRRYRHGHKPAGGASPEYIVWNGMRARCNNPRNPNYARYGARGITVCERWQSDFMNFLADMGRRPAPWYTLERRDNDGDYTPDNCVWATKQDQANNRRSSRIIAYGGVMRTAAEWARARGISNSTLHARLKAGWTIGRALNEPLNAPHKTRRGR